MVGVQWNDLQQQQMMKQAFVRYAPECNFPPHPSKHQFEYYTRNGYFGYVSAVVMHSMVRYWHPRKIVEIGAGNSTLVLAHAAQLNAAEVYTAELIAIDPYPAAVLRRQVPGLTQVIARPVQDVDPALFTGLQANDVLSIDSSHSIKTGGDVPYIYLEVLPLLAPGVIIHIHDVFLPMEYPHEWIRRRFFWNEQYLLHGLLVHTNGFEVLWGQKYAEARFPEEYQVTFATKVDEIDNYNSYSFWLRRIQTSDSEDRKVGTEEGKHAAN